MRRYNTIDMSTRPSYVHLHEDAGSSQRESSHAQVRKPLPIFSVLLFAALWLAYFLGIAVDGSNVNEINLFSAISTSDSRLWYYTVTPWPQCKDVRSEVWRLLSLQFAHRTIVESYFPVGYATTLLVYLTGLAGGTLVFSLTSPYNGLIGASPGAYALYGSCIAMVLSSLFCRGGLKLDRMIKFVLPPTLVVHAVMETALFFTSYQDEVGYVSHWAGVLIGFLSSWIVIGVRKQANVGLRVLAAISLVILLVGVSLGLFVRYTHWPPVAILPGYNSLKSCCKGYIEYVGKDPQSSGHPGELGYCQAGVFVPLQSA